VLWLDAGQLNGLADGASVSRWPDRSGAGFVATQTISARQPVYLADVLNGRPVVDFDGVDDYLTITASLVGGGRARTVAFVARPNVVAATGIMDLGDGSRTGGAFMITPETAVRVGVGYRIWRNALPTARASVGVVILNGKSTDNLAGWIDGSPLGVASTVTTSINTKGVTTIGSWTASPIGPYNFAGDIAELIVYDRALSTTERQQIERYLASKYSLF
jgi:hypothetical protein